MEMSPPPTTLGGPNGGLGGGTVAADDADTGEFAVVEPDGANVAVTTGILATVVTLTTVTTDQLQVGGCAPD